MFENVIKNIIHVNKLWFLGGETKMTLKDGNEYLALLFALP